MARGTLGEVRQGLRTLGEVWEGMGEPRGSPGRVEEPSGMSWMGRVSNREVRDGSEDPR